MALQSPTQPATHNHDSSSWPSQAVSGQPSKAIGAKMPRQTAPSVAELSNRLYAAYTVEGGSVRLAGCTLEPQPIIHVVARLQKQLEKSGNGGAATSVVQPSASTIQIQSTPNHAVSTEQATEWFLTSSGQLLDAAAIAELGLNELTNIDKPPRLLNDELTRLTSLATGTAGSEADSIQTEIVWCKFAAGKLRFTIGKQFVDVPFADWAARLLPPPFVCPYSGKSTFKLAAIDDGRIVAAEEIATCQESGNRMLQSELVTCSVTGKQVSPDLTEICPATGQPVQQSQIMECPTCRSRVSPQAVVRDRCKLCREPSTMVKTDSRIVPILAAHPGLNRWHHWTMATRAQTFTLEATSLWRQLLVVLDKQSLMPLRIAGRNRLQRSWTDVPQQTWQEILK